MPRQIVLVLLLLVGGCRAASQEAPMRAVDLIRDFDRADQRPRATFSIVDHKYPSILAPAPGRLTWTLPLPRHGRFHAVVAVDGPAAVRFRVVVSDDRVSENLSDIVGVPAGGFTDLTVNLSAYAGRKWSLFYRPDSIAWHLTLSTDAVAGIASRGLWGSPELVTDRAGMRDYLERRASR
jgi:hypothetical protein